MAAFRASKYEATIIAERGKHATSDDYHQGPSSRTIAMSFQLLHPRDQWAAIMDRIYGTGMATLSRGNPSKEASDGDIWTKPSAVGKLNLAPVGDVGIRDLELAFGQDQNWP